MTNKNQANEELLSIDEFLAEQAPQSKDKAERGAKRRIGKAKLDTLPNVKMTRENLQTIFEARKHFKKWNLASVIMSMLFTDSPEEVATSMLNLKNAIEKLENNQLVLQGIKTYIDLGIKQKA